MGVQFRNEQFLTWSRPHKGLWWGVRLYAAAGNPRPPARRAYASERERRAGQKGPFMDGHYSAAHYKIKTWKLQAKFNKLEDKACNKKVVDLPFKRHYSTLTRTSRNQKYLPQRHKGYHRLSGSTFKVPGWWALTGSIQKSYASIEAASNSHPMGARDQSWHWVVTLSNVKML